MPYVNALFLQLFLSFESLGKKNPIFIFLGILIKLERPYLVQSDASSNNQDCVVVGL